MKMKLSVQRAKQDRLFKRLENALILERSQIIRDMQRGRWRAVAIRQRKVHTIQIYQIQLARRFNRPALFQRFMRRLYTSRYRPFGPAQTIYAPYSMTYPQRQYRPAPTSGAQQNYLVAAGLAGLGGLEISTGMGGVL